MNSAPVKDSEKPSRETVAQAAAWISRLHGSRRSPEVEGAFRSWLAADKQHARAFEGMTEIWETLPAMHMGELSRPGVLSEMPSRTASPARFWARAAAIVGVCVAVGLLAYGFFRDTVYTTGIGEQRIVNLEDGTRVSLNSGTRMSVQYGNLERRIELKSGEAFFEVARNPHLPFVVLAGGNRVTALGTSFAVRYERDRTAVTLVEGKVTVASAPSSAFTSPTPLSPGQRLTVAKRAPPILDTPEVEAVTAWRRGEVIFDETVLAEAVAEMNRYDKISIVLDDPAIVALPVSGIYRTGDSPGFAAIVARMYDLGVVHKNGRIYLQGEPKPSP